MMVSRMVTLSGTSTVLCTIRVVTMKEYIVSGSRGASGLLALATRYTGECRDP